MNPVQKIFRLIPVLSALAGSAFAAGPDYRVLATFPDPGKSGRFDYLFVDPADRRLYVAHDTCFDVLNADTGKKIGEVAPVTRAHGVAVSRATGHGFATSGGDSVIVMFDLKTLAVLKRIPSTGKGPDAIAFDPESKRIYVANHGDGAFTVIDPATGAITGTIQLGGKLEEIAFDGRGHAFVNNEGGSSVHVVDTRTLRRTATWSLAPGEGGTGLAIDAAHHRLFSACGNNKVVVLDSDTGKIVATPAIGDDPDGLRFDPGTGLIFCPNSDGTFNIIHEETPDRYTVIQTLPTLRGCRTIALDPKTGRIFTCSQQYGPKPAATEDNPKPRAPAIPGTFAVFAIGPR